MKIQMAVRIDKVEFYYKGDDGPYQVSGTKVYLSLIRMVHE